jgi:hypothetical protein
MNASAMVRSVSSPQSWLKCDVATKASTVQND